MEIRAASGPRRYPDGMPDAAGPSLLKRALAVVVLAAAALFLIKALIGFLAGIITFVFIVVAVVAVIWALRTL